MKKASSIGLWIASIFFLLLSLIGCFNSPTSLLFLIPTILLNPIFKQRVLSKFNLKHKKLIIASSIIVPFIVFTACTPNNPTTQTVQTNQTSSSITLSSITSSSTSSTTLSSATPSLSSTPTIKQAVTAPKNGAKLKVHYIDVGQGDSEFIELSNGQTMLIDAGNPENGSQIVDYIKSLKHNKIDYLIATHPHADHIGGMTTVVDSLNIGKIYMPKKSTNTKTYEGLLTAIKSKGLKVNTAKSGVNILKTGNLNIDIIAPVNITGDDLNQYSAVIMLTYGDNKFLFTGDAGEQSESQITANVKADVLKVGHHGSNTATSQTFLNKVHPKYAVIEVGQGNSYGHPTAATLSKLQNIGATIYRTDKDGTVIFTSDSHTITVDKKASTIKENAPSSSTHTKTKVSSKTSPKNPIVKQQTPQEDNQSITVYITDSGKKYHKDGCRYLKKSKHAISLKDAKAQGYEPCKKCHPPQ